MNEKEYDQLARSECFMCRILEGDPMIPNPEIVYEDERVFVMLNQLPTQEGYCLVCPKKHAERFETDLTTEEWIHLQTIVQKTAKAIRETTEAIRVYTASLGSPERNSHIHIHVCPCPKGTPFDQQQFEAMKTWKTVEPTRMQELAGWIRELLSESRL